MKDLDKFWPKPRCCAAIRRHPFVVVDVDRDEDGEEAPRAWWVWGVRVDDGLERTGIYSFDIPPAPTHCPFCQTQLPQLRLRSNPPSPLCVATDHYCLTCNERLYSCECYPPQCGWEVESP